MSVQREFVVFSDDWGRHPSSCQHLMTQLARRHRILWVNTIGMRSPKVDGFTLGRAVDKIRQWRSPLMRISDNFHVYAPPMLPAAGGLTGKINSQYVARRLRATLDQLNFREPIIFASVPTAADYVGQLGERALVYYITDDYRLWPGANAAVIAAQDEKLSRLAHLLLPCGKSLAENRPARAPMELLPHAVDLDHFAAPREDEPEPADLQDIPRPRLCFFGLIYEKVDLTLFARLARENPDKHVVLLGPIKCDTAELAGLPNVHLLGPKPYAELPRYLQAMDALLLAYRLDEQTLRNSPLKIRECLAVGKPVVAIDVPDLRRYGDLIHLAAGHDEFLAACRRACELPKASPVEMRAAVAGDTWQARAEKVEQALERALDVRAVNAVARTSVEPCTDSAAWDAYVDSHVDGSVWQRWGWSQVMRWTYGLSCHFLIARRDENVVGVLPLAMQSSRAFGRHLVSLPWLDFAGVLADDSRARLALLRAAETLAYRQNADLVLRERHSDDDGQVRTDKAAMTLDLPPSAEALWDGFKTKVRNQVRKAEKSGLLGSWAGLEQLPAFYDIYSTNMRDLGSPPHSLKFFRQVFRHFDDVARLAMVKLDGKPVATALVLTDERGWQVPWASSLRSYNNLCPSHALYWTILQQACGRTRQFCFGRSTVDSGTYKFKAQWGAVEQPLYWRTLLAAGKAADQAVPGRRVALIQRVWQRIPASMAKMLGPYIIRHVS